MTLTSILVLWAVVTTAVVVLAYARMSLGLHDLLHTHLTRDPTQALERQDVERGVRLEWLDRIGIPMTVLSALLALAALFMWALESAGPS